MSSKIPVSTVVAVSIGLISGAATRKGFGIPMIVDTQNILGAGAGVPVVRSYANVASMLADGFDEFSKAVKMAASLIAAVPRIATFKVASVNSLSSAELTAVEAGGGEWYLFLVTSRASADLQTCATWCENTATRRHVFFGETQDPEAFTAAPSILSILVAAGRRRTAVFARKANPQLQTLTISSAFVAANSITLKVNGVTPAGFPIVFAANSDAVLAAVAAALQALPEIAAATVTAVAGADNDREIVIEAADPLVDVFITDYACTMGLTQNTAEIVVTEPGAIPADCAAAGYLIPQSLGEAVLAGKGAPNLAVDDLSLTEFELVTSKGGNVYVDIGDIEQFQKGQMMGKTQQGAILFIDTIVGVDRFEQALQDAVMAQLATGKKLPFNNIGIGAVASTLDRVARDYVAKGILEPFQFVDAINFPDISEVSPANRSARHLPDVTGAFQGTGAIQSVALDVTVAV